MPSAEFLSMLNIKAKENDVPVIQQIVDGQTALQLQPQEETDPEYQPYDVEARKEGWLVLQSNEMYNAQASKNTEIFIMRTDNDTWEAWRETWKEGSPKSISLRQIAKGVPFPVALKQATNYVKVLTKRR